MPLSAPSRPWLYPAGVWFGVLATMFVTEYLVMLLLPQVLPGQVSRLLEAAVDALVLVAVLAPLIWRTVVHPLQEVNRLRARFLTDLFAQIEADRRQTAHELHDGVGQVLSLLVSGLRSAGTTSADAEDARRKERLLELAQGALRDVRRLARGLRCSLLDDLGLAPALERLTQDVRDHHSIELSLDAEAVAGVRLPEAVETALFRIAQEALANVVTHAAARTAAVRIRCDAGTVTVEVIDDGCGFDPATPRAAGGLGLTGMRERATLLGGSFAVSAAPGQGTHIVASIPTGG